MKTNNLIFVGVLACVFFMTNCTKKSNDDVVESKASNIVAEVNGVQIKEKDLGSMLLGFVMIKCWQKNSNRFY